MMIRTVFLMLAFTLAGLGLPASAQLTSGISGPEVSEGKRAAGYRAAYDPDSNGLAQRVHVDYALNGRMLVRGVIHARKTDAETVDFDYAQAELRWQMTPDGARWASGLRFDARLRDDDRPGQVSLHWLNQFRLSDTLTARFTAIGTVQTGSNRQSGTFLQTRGDLGWAIAPDIDVGAELYNSFGRTSDILPLSEQSHQIGPFADLPLTDSLSLRTSALFGVTSGSPDATFRVFLTQDF